MKQVNFKSTKIKNFMSIGEDEVSIKFKQGLNMITGKNLDNPERKNAVGKSTVMNAFFWGLFGETIGKIANKNIVNYVTNKKGFVEIEFDVIENGKNTSYKIIRRLKPSSVELYKDSVDVSRDSIKNTNAEICRIVSSNAMISKCTDIMSISDNAPFMTQTAEAKRKFISNIFNVIIFDLMRNSVKADVKVNKTNKQVVDGKISTLESSLESLEEKKQEFDEELATRQQKYDNMVKKINDNIETYQEKLDKLSSEKVDDDRQAELSDLEDEYKTHNSEYKDKVQQFKEVRAKISSKIEFIDKDIKKRKSVKGGVCDKCLQEVCEDHEELIASQITELEAQLEELQQKDDKASKAIRTYRKKCSDVEEKLDDVYAEQRKIERHNNEIERVVEKIDDLKQQKKEIQSSFKQNDEKEDTFSKLITETNEKLGVMEEELDEYRFETDVLDVCGFVLGDEGVKSIIIKKLLKILNSNITSYLGMMGLDMRCEFDEYFDETIKSKGGNETSYFNCSGAERKTIDIACSLAFSDLRQRTCGVYSNVKFFDEIFDSAFDERGLDMFIEMLKNKINDSGWSVYAISHRKEAIKHIDGQVVELVKHKEVTSLK